MAVQQEVFAKLKDIIVEQLAVEADEVTLEASFIEDLNADSLDLVELIMEIEEKFGIQVPDEVADKIVTVNDAVEYIQEHQE